MGAAVTRRQDDEQRRANVRLGLILASLAAAFGVGFAVKIWLLGA